VSLANSATLAESPIDILLWDFPLKSRFADAAQADPQAIRFSSIEVARRHATVDHRLRSCHLAGRIAAEEQHPIRDILHLLGVSEHHPGFGRFAWINRPVASADVALSNRRVVMEPTESSLLSSPRFRYRAARE
jgi:hypothetical protein